MYEHLIKLRPDLIDIDIVRTLTPLEPQDIVQMREQHSGCPEEYFQFITEIGVGMLENTIASFLFESRLLSAENDVYGDKQIYEYGAKGDIFIFGFMNHGMAYGFDSEDQWKVKEIAQDRIVTPLDLTFKQFVEGLVVCYPQIPMKYANGVWMNITGRKYSLSGT